MTAFGFCYRRQRAHSCRSDSPSTKWSDQYVCHSWSGYLASAGQFVGNLHYCVHA